jgi:hypothetical protein
MEDFDWLGPALVCLTTDLVHYMSVRESKQHDRIKRARPLVTPKPLPSQPQSTNVVGGSLRTYFRSCKRPD